MAILKKDKGGQAVFIAAIFGLAAMIVFFLALPTLLSFTSETVANLDNAFASLLIMLIPIFVFVMIVWAVIAIARSE